MKKNNWMTWFIILAFLMPMGIIIIINIVSPTTFMVQKAVDDVVVSSFNYEKAFSIYVEWFAAFCTILLGIVAATQNNRLQALEERADNRQNSCNIYIENNNEDSVLDLFNIESYEDKDETRILSNKSKEYAGEWKYISFTMENYSNAFLKEIDIFFGDIHFNSNVTLIEHKKQKFAVNIPKSLEDNKEHICKIVFTSCYNVKTYGSFNIFMPVREYEEEMDMVDIYNYSFYGTEQPK